MSGRRIIFLAGVAVLVAIGLIAQRWLQRSSGEDGRTRRVEQVDQRVAGDRDERVVRDVEVTKLPSQAGDEGRRAERDARDRASENE